eukprot:7265812-Lingulodinium_polyedra.AAC.1
MRTAGDPREAAAPEWAAPESGGDPEAEFMDSDGRNEGGDDAQLPCAVWDLSARVACAACRVLHACR